MLAVVQWCSGLNLWAGGGTDPLGILASNQLHQRASRQRQPWTRWISITRFHTTHNHTATTHTPATLAYNTRTSASTPPNLVSTARLLTSCVCATRSTTSSMGLEEAAQGQLRTSPKSLKPLCPRVASGEAPAAGLGRGDGLSVDLNQAVMNSCTVLLTC